MSRAPQALMLTSDLLFSSRVCSAAEQLGGHVQIVGSADAARQRAEEQPIRMLILDLAMPGCRPDQTLAVWNQLEEVPPVVAFGPHVAEAQLQAASQAGCTEVLTRGQFDRQLNALLRRYLCP